MVRALAGYSTMTNERSLPLGDFVDLLDAAVADFLVLDAAFLAMACSLVPVVMVRDFVSNRSLATGRNTAVAAGLCNAGQPYAATLYDLSACSIGIAFHCSTLTIGPSAAVDSPGAFNRSDVVGRADARGLKLPRPNPTANGIKAYNLDASANWSRAKPRRAAPICLWRNS